MSSETLPLTADLVLTEAFIEMQAGERGAALNTLEAYGRDIMQFLEEARTLFPQQAQSPYILTHVTTDDLRRYFSALDAQGLARSTLYRKLSCLRQLFIFLQLERYRNDNPALALEGPLPSRSLPKFLSEQQVMALLDQAKAEATQKQDLKSYRLQLLIELLYATGLRVSELVSLPLATIRGALQQGQPYLYVVGKGNKERIVPLSPRALACLENYITYLNPAAGEKWLFPSRGKAGHLTRHRFGQLLKELGMRAGLPTKKLSPHVVRHAFATHLLSNGAHLRAVQQLLGHADITTTQIYTHVLEDEMRQLVQEQHPLAEKRRGRRIVGEEK
ncbi:MAG: tyrosine recombinase [Kordiimonas sp.]|nr:tyrosine recombinase [Kordiimonas sp.]